MSSSWGNSTCLSPDNPQVIWPYCPSEAAAILFTVLFFITTAGNAFFALKYKKGFCWVLTMGACWEFVAFGIRSAGTQYQLGFDLYVSQLVLILLSPLWINAFIYLLFARMVYYFDQSQKIGRIRATRVGLLFVTCDLITFLVQLYGVSLMTQQDAQSQTNGKNIYMGGLGIQETFIIIFAIFVCRFWMRMRTAQVPRPTSYNPTTLLICISLALITIRIIFRCVEYSSGFNGPIPSTESFQYIFDAVPMLVATTLWIIWHPGRVLVGPEANFPSRKEKKAIKQQLKAQKLQGKDANKNDGRGSFQFLSGGVQDNLRGISPGRKLSGSASYAESQEMGALPSSYYDPPVSDYQGLGDDESGRYHSGYGGAGQPAPGVVAPGTTYYYGADREEAGLLVSHQR